MIFVKIGSKANGSDASPMYNRGTALVRNSGIRSTIVLPDVLRNTKYVARAASTMKPSEIKPSGNFIAVEPYIAAQSSHYGPPISNVTICLRFSQLFPSCQHDRTPVTTKHENSGERAHNGIGHCAIKLG